MSSRMSFEPSALMADERYGRHPSPIELGLCERVRSVADSTDPEAMRTLALELLEALKEECGGGTTMVMLSNGTMAVDCVVRHDERGSKDGLACAVWLLLDPQDDAESKQTTFIRHVRPHTNRTHLTPRA
jgi:hypothetical protein